MGGERLILARAAAIAALVLLEHGGVSGFLSSSSSTKRPALLRRVVQLEAEATNATNGNAIKDYRQGMSAIGGGRNSESPIDDTDVVMKFGGSSLADEHRIDYVANLIKSQREAGFRPRAVVCSAMGKSTNNLLHAGDQALEGKVCVQQIKALHEETMKHFEFPQNTVKEVQELLDECEDMLTGVRMIQELSPKSLDQLVSYGERCSVRIMAARLNQIGVPAQAFDAWEVGVQTTSEFGDAKLLPESEEAIRNAFKRLDPETVAVVTGFIGHEANDRITTLGRGGSDLTATALGAAIGVDEIQVWKDVDGILTSDPRLVESAIPVPQVTYEEASELAYFGAQVLHPIAMQPALKAGVPVRVKNSYNPSAVGTIIRNDKTSEQLVTAITYKRHITLMDIRSTQMLGAYGFLARVFREFEKHRLSVDVLASSEVSVSLTLDKKQDSQGIDALMASLKECADITLECDKAILTLIADVARSSEVLSSVFDVFTKEGIQVKMMSQGASKVNISFLVDDEDLDRAILSLHSVFFEGGVPQTAEQSTDKAELDAAMQQESANSVVATP